MLRPLHLSAVLGLADKRALMQRVEIVQYGNGSGSVNLYMAHGGSSWGFWSGMPDLNMSPAPTEYASTHAVLWCAW